MAGAAAEFSLIRRRAGGGRGWAGEHPGRKAQSARLEMPSEEPGIAAGQGDYLVVG